MEVAFALALLVLFVGQIVLFAMFGELAGRVESAQLGSPDRVEPLDDLVQRPVDTWLDFEPLPQGPVSALVVLSIGCRSCLEIAKELKRVREAIPASVLVLTGPSEQAIEAFIDTFAMRESGIPLAVDIGGEWSASAVGVTRTPAVVMLEAGLVSEGFLISSVGALEDLSRQVGVEW